MATLSKGLAIPALGLATMPCYSSKCEFTVSEPSVKVNSESRKPSKRQWSGGRNADVWHRSPIDSGKFPRNGFCSKAKVLPGAISLRYSKTTQMTQNHNNGVLTSGRQRPND